MSSGGPTSAGLDRARLDRLLGGPELGWLRDRVRRRLERDEPLTGPISLTGPSPAQRAAVERLLGRPPGTGRTLTVRLDAVDAVLRHSGVSPDGLATAVAALTSPVALLSDVRDREARAWDDSYVPLRTLAAQRPELAVWSAKVRADGLVRRLAGTPDTARDLVADTVTALRELPAAPAVSLPAFAARVLGSAHALDDGKPPATLVLSAIRALTGFPDGSGTEWRREAWASAGLLRDDLSSTVLTLGMRGTPALDWLAETGEPAVLTLRQLHRRPPMTAPAAVRICENPAVLSAAADTYGSACPPLVCLQGQPSAAAVTLLRHLHHQGATLHYHGDFDWGGLRIASSLLRRVPWHPWRFTAADYRAAAPGTGTPLIGTPAESPWDPELALSLAALGVRVEEEAVLDELTSDLSRPPE
ncbi:TIGR02679 family protein [Actinacidiphila soli]|uniref:TIGR02679 family protein n=1 Tax=Actinacidiphila soli TaxID=2487275 RepID=UPI000FCC3944|nr:TIGR02679 family protein [Actinacidiphila soli]